MSKTNSRKIGILGAMPEEMEGIRSLLTECSVEHIGMRHYYTGMLNGIPVVLAFSRWGKVAAATTVTTMIQRYGINELIFTGVAGAIDPGLRIGDIVLAKRLIQHDMDARPLMPRYELPLLGISYIESSHPKREKMASLIRELISGDQWHTLLPADIPEQFSLSETALYEGDIASGDQFFSATEQKEALQLTLPGILCVEMEGAAVAQVCYEYQIPFIVIRIISDSANTSSHTDFSTFIQKVSSRYIREIINKILR